MNCVSNVTTSILWNGEALPEFAPEKGLHQGDPLSPYLFVLCMERLSNMITNKVDQGSWKGIYVSRSSTLVTHIFFVDDLILFGQASKSTCIAILEVLNSFYAISCQSINFNKSKVFFLPQY